MVDECHRHSKWAYLESIGMGRQVKTRSKGKIDRAEDVDVQIKTRTIYTSATTMDS